ncbi:adenylate/guanylate cyclase domain-containing protein [Seonamhaeicola marinus]|uniref:Adenylate/guanylate cyclase domain-containing protein n=1 Tax=Seonamhaeicola marinus TaxID=1912246 RepID=A0A5D0HFI0_9FLAO|nr:adenylate/guanylate cyclase domain-containing protein [Seonamhaeicola marinus]TYA70154.1 adenylate/guanylate cyclase domain-containing protein [Seonamhaeicola marinus]
MMQLHPLYKRYFIQIFSFGLIWLFFGLVYVMLEYGILGRLTYYPATGNKYNVINSLFMVCVGSFLMGIVQGVVEIFWLKKYFRRSPFWIKIAFKSIFYLVFVFVFVIVIALINNAYLYDTSVFDPVVINMVFGFISKFAFWSVILYVGVVLDLALFYSEIKDYMGNNALFNYFGKYHRPKPEVRIFMFLDMKSSTAIAENLGHQKYFELLRTYYADMTNAILETSGEVYQYVGDEIVITWKQKQGIHKNNCLHCFRKISKAINSHSDKYLKAFGLIPEFKAGYHIGSVTAGEIGIIKKDIVYTGDILNTSARIQAECNNYNSKILISGQLMDSLEKDNTFSFTKIDDLLLRGKKQPIQLFEINFI